MKQKIDNLYLVNGKFYTNDMLEILEFNDDDIQYSYIEPTLYIIGNNIYMMYDNENEYCEFIRKINNKMYESVTVIHSDRLKRIMKDR